MALNVFPQLPGLAWPVSRTVAFKNARMGAVSGARTAYAMQIVPRWTWKIDFEFLRSQAAYQEMQTLAAFFSLCLGGAYTFSYQDAQDNSVTNQQFSVGDGTTVAFQLVRSLNGSSEPVYLPTGTPEIFVNGTLQASGYTIGATGIVTFAAAPAANSLLTWTGSFNWLCRFDADDQEFSNFMDNLWEAKGLQFSNEINP
jgi:uncharacterized protein (TIGR02217 family)